MLRSAIALSALLAVSSPAAAAKPAKQSQYLHEVEIGPALRAWIEKGVRERLKDPESARFGAIAGRGDGDGAIFVCGWVNAKNSFGGYPGKQPFNGLLSDLNDGKTSRPFFVLGLGGSEIDTERTLRGCREHGVKF